MLAVHNLTCGYGSGFCLREVTFSVGRGEIVGIIGPNGSGKTTLFRAVTGIISPLTGSVVVDGLDASRLSPRGLARILAVVSRPGDNDVGMSVEEYVLLGRIPHRQGLGFLEDRRDIQIARQALTLTGILPLRDRPMSDLSSGERQLASIARAIAQEPRFLLLDEPTSHLDIGHQVGVLDLIRRLNRETGLTLVIVLHDLNLAAQYCDRLLLMDNGSLRKEGTPDEVLTYGLIESVYKTVVVVRKNPMTAKPYVILVSEEERNGQPLPR